MGDEGRQDALRSVLRAHHGEVVGLGLVPASAPDHLLHMEPMQYLLCSHFPHGSSQAGATVYLALMGPQSRKQGCSDKCN